MDNTWTFTYHYEKGRGKNKVTTEVVKTFRRLTCDEMKQLSYGDHIDFISRQGMIKTVKVNGNPQTWKRNPNHVKVPVKYGLYEYSYSEYEDGNYFGEILVKEVESEESNV